MGRIGGESFFFVCVRWDFQDGNEDVRVGYCDKEKWDQSDCRRGGKGNGFSQ